MTDIAERLRYLEDRGIFAAADAGILNGLFAEAADTLESMAALRPMADAPRDGTVIIGVTLPDLPLIAGAWDPSRWAGRIIPMRHEGKAPGGYDMGWSVALPVGHGGLPDEWFKGWIPVPQPWRG